MTFSYLGPQSLEGHIQETEWENLSPNTNTTNYCKFKGKATLIAENFKKKKQFSQNIKDTKWIKTFHILLKYSSPHWWENKCGKRQILCLKVDKKVFQKNKVF